jgi:DNA-binding LacI/PurR family transcriptional regulator
MLQNTAKMLPEIIENRPNEDFTIKNLKLKTELIVRQSTTVAP